MQLYFKLLKPDGVLAVHISNRYLDLAPVCERGAEFVGKKATVVADDASDNTFANSTTWVLITAPDNNIFQSPSFAGREHVPGHCRRQFPRLDRRLQQHPSDPQLELSRGLQPGLPVAGSPCPLSRPARLSSSRRPNPGTSPRTAPVRRSAAARRTPRTAPGPRRSASSGIRRAQSSAHRSSFWNCPRLAIERGEKHATNASEISTARRIARGQSWPGSSLSLSSQVAQPGRRDSVPQPPRQRQILFHVGDEHLRLGLGDELVAAAGRPAGTSPSRRSPPSGRAPASAGSSSESRSSRRSSRFRSFRAPARTTSFPSPGNSTGRPRRSFLTIRCTSSSIRSWATAAGSRASRASSRASSSCFMLPRLAARRPANRAVSVIP